MNKLNSYGRCVYTSPEGLCDGLSPLHPKEHYMPAGLGNFRDDIRLKNYICYECQKRFGKLEDVFLHNSSEAFFRDILGKKSRTSHAAKNIFIEPTHSISPLTVKGLHPGIGREILWQMSSEDHAFPLHQLIFEKPDGSVAHLALRKGKITHDLERLSEQWRDWKLVCCIAGSDNEEELQSIFGSNLEPMPDKTAELEVQGLMEAEMWRPLHSS